MKIQVGSRVVYTRNLSYKQQRAMVAVSFVAFLYWLREYEVFTKYPFLVTDASRQFTVYGEDFDPDMRESIRWALRLYREVLPTKWKDERKGVDDNEERPIGGLGLRIQYAPRRVQ